MVAIPEKQPIFYAKDKDIIHITLWTYVDELYELLSFRLSIKCSTGVLINKNKALFHNLLTRLSSPFKNDVIGIR